MEIYLLIAASVVIACVFLNRISSLSGVPTLLLFLVLGMVFGVDGILKINFDNQSFAENVCTFALIFIMFYGGFGTNVKSAKSVAAKSVLLSTLGVIITAGITGLFCRFALKFGWLESFLIGSVISSTDAASVFSILKSKKLNLKNNTASLLEIESGSNDPCSYMLTIIFISALKGTVGGWSLAYLIFAQIVYGVAFGVAIAFVASFVLKKFDFKSAGFDTIFVLGVAIVSYALPSYFGGNGYLSAYIVGIYLGNKSIKNKKNLVNFFDGITSLMQIVIFFLLGLLSYPSKLLPVALPALAIAVFITLVSRPIAVVGLLSPFKSPWNQQAVVAFSGLRGASSVVFALMAGSSLSGVLTVDLFHIVFFIVLFSILIQGSLLPLVSKKTGMIDAKFDVMKTFTDYTEEVPVQFISFAMPENHDWCEKTLSEISLPPETLVVMLERKGKSIIPNGKTVLKPLDKIILSAIKPEDISGVKLNEISLSVNHEYIGKTVSAIPKTNGSLIVIIKRGEKVIIPRGNVILKENDILVLSFPEND